MIRRFLRDEPSRTDRPPPGTCSSQASSSGMSTQSVCSEELKGAAMRLIGLASAVFVLALTCAIAGFNPEITPRLVAAHGDDNGRHERDRDDRNQVDGDKSQRAGQAIF